MPVVMCDEIKTSTAVLKLMMTYSTGEEQLTLVAKNISEFLQPISESVSTNRTEISFDKLHHLSPDPEIEFFTVMEEKWGNRSEVVSWVFYSDSVFLAWFLYLARCVIVPCLLFYITLLLWEVRFLRMRDPSSPLPLPPGSMGIPFLGEMLQFFIIGTKYQRERQREFGNVYRTHMFGRPTIIAIGDKHVRRLLLGEGQLVQTLWPSMTRKILGENGIVNGDKQTHTTIKRLALRAFSPKHMGKYAPIVQEGISRHIQTWKGKLPVLEICKQMVSRTMMTVLLGINPEDPAIQNYIQAADDVINSIFSLPINLPGFAYPKGLRAKEFVFKNLSEKLRSKIEASDEELFGEESQDEVESVLLNIIKLARKEGTDIKLINLQNLSLEFIFAGTQSLQCASASMICHLSERPEVVDRLRKEIRQHGLWEKPMNEVNFEEIQLLKFADCVIQETMRVTPSIPGCVRVASKTFELGGYQVPKGWQVIYSIKLTHEFTVGKALQNGGKCEYDPDVYFNCPRCKSDQSKIQNNENDWKEKKRSTSGIDNNKFIVKPNEKQSHVNNDVAHVCSKTAGDYSYIPFGKGARMCAGKNYGMLFLRVMLFELVRTTNFKLHGKLKFSAVPMTKPHQSVMVEFEKLKK